MSPRQTPTAEGSAWLPGLPGDRRPDRDSNFMAIYGTMFSEPGAQHLFPPPPPSSSSSGPDMRARSVLGPRLEEGRPGQRHPPSRSRSRSVPPRRHSSMDSDSAESPPADEAAIIALDAPKASPGDPSRKRHRPSALNFQEPGSLATVDETVARVAAETTMAWGPGSEGGSRGGEPYAGVGRKPRFSRYSSPSSSISSSSVGSRPSSRFGTADSEPATSPEASDKASDGGIGGELDDATPKPTPTSNRTGAGTSTVHRRHRAYRYGTPEMPRGDRNLPHLPASALHPRVPNSGHVKHLPRAEKLPLTGYQLVASKLSTRSPHLTRFRRASLGAASTFSTQSANSGGGGSAAGAESVFEPAQAQIKPLYRKFEVLNHRVLLQLQDELSELEEQLHRLDTADTQTRRLQNRILPASRRSEFLAGGELQWHKTDILGKIGFKLGQYNHALSSFAETQRLPSPRMHDINGYRAYLANEQPIAEMETRFLDVAEDLITLAPTQPESSSKDSSSSEDCLPGAFYRTMDNPRSPVRSTSSQSSNVSSFPRFVYEEANGDGKKPSSGNKVTDDSNNNTSLPHLLNGIIVTMLTPVLASALVPGMVTRMLVAFGVAFAMFGMQMQAGTIGLGQWTAGRQRNNQDVVLSASVFAVGMVVVSRFLD